MTTQVINQRVIVFLPDTLGKYTATRTKHILSGKTVRDLILSLKVAYPSASEALDNCVIDWNGRRLLLDNEVYDGDEIYLKETKR